MRRLPAPVAVVTLAVLLMALLTYGLLTGGARTNLDTAVQRGQRPVAPAADVALPRLGAPGEQRLADLRGKVVVLNIWASWCPPCEEEAPILNAMHTALDDAGEGQVLGITHIDPSAKSLAKQREWKLRYPSLRDVDDTLYQAFGATAPPETYVIDAEGRIVAMARGTINAEFANAALKAAGVRARIDPATKLKSDA